MAVAKRLLLRALDFKGRSGAPEFWAWVGFAVAFTYGAVSLARITGLLSGASIWDSWASALILYVATPFVCLGAVSAFVRRGRDIRLKWFLYPLFTAMLAIGPFLPYLGLWVLAKDLEPEAAMVLAVVYTIGVAWIPALVGIIFYAIVATVMSLPSRQPRDD